MSEYVVELSFPGAAHLTAPEVDMITARTRRLADELGPGIEWLAGYLTEDGVVAVYRADAEGLVRAHAAHLGLDVSSLDRVTAVIAPAPHPTREERR